MNAAPPVCRIIAGPNGAGKSVEFCELRGRERVRHGGHNIPSRDIERRFPRSLHNLLHRYAAEVDSARCLLNHRPTPELVFVQQGSHRTILIQDAFAVLLRGASA